MENQVYYFHSPQAEGEKRHTVAGVYDKGKISLGLASCSEKDSFVKSKGREIALQRAQEAKNGVVVLGNNKHKGIAFRAIAIGMVSSMLSDKFKF